MFDHPLKGRPALGLPKPCRGYEQRLGQFLLVSDSCRIRECEKPLPLRRLRPQVHRIPQLQLFDSRHSRYNDKELCHFGKMGKLLTRGGLSLIFPD
jgi:hypothetical protein